MKQYPQSSLITFCKYTDQINQREIGTTLALFRKIIALRLFEFNLEIDYRDIILSDILVSNLIDYENKVHATY